MQLEFTSRIKLSEGLSPAQAVSFTGEFCIIGRTEGNVILSEPRASKRHCVIFQSHDGRLMVKDFGSTNGTYLNGKRIDEAQLKVGDELRIGKTVLALKRFEATAKAAPPLPQLMTQTGTKSYVGQIPESIQISEVKEEVTDGQIIRGWPHGYQAMPKEKAGKFIEYVDNEGTKTRISLEELKKKKVS